MRPTRSLALCAVVLVNFGFLAHGQSRPPAYGPMGDIGQANLPGQKIGPNDLVAVSVYDSPELTRTVRISADGMLTLPMVKQKVRAAGLLPGELELAVAAALKNGGILVEPVVAVTVVEYYSRPITVVGAVRKPLTFQAIGSTTLLEALGKAEGLTTEAGPDLVLSELDASNPSGPRLLRRISLRQLIDENRPELNVVLHGGEEIRVPDAKKIYVTGNVKRPGAFPVREGSPMTVMKALALAEGLTPYHQKQAFIVRGAPGERSEIPIELAKILKRQSEDVALQPEDMLYVPDNAGRRTFATVAEKASGFSIATISGMLIWRR